MKNHTYLKTTLKSGAESLHTWQLKPAQPQPNAPIAILLHGAGTADSSRAKGLAQAFAEAGIAVVALDFVGHGKSSGQTKNLSLQRRTDDALAVITHWTQQTDQLILCGFSMSGHTVLRLTELLGERVVSIGLFCPAIYAKEAELVPFTEKFTEVIRRPNSWLNSLALQNANDFKGRVHLMIGAHDEVIPWPVMNTLLEAFRTSAQETRLVLVKDVSHRLAVWLNDQPSHCRDIVDYLYQNG